MSTRRVLPHPADGEGFWVRPPSRRSLLSASTTAALRVTAADLKQAKLGPVLRHTEPQRSSFASAESSLGLAGAPCWPEPLLLPGAKEPQFLSRDKG